MAKKEKVDPNNELEVEQEEVPANQSDSAMTIDPDTGAPISYGELRAKQGEPGPAPEETSKIDPPVE